MIVTTAGRTNEGYIEKAKSVAKQLQLLYVPRNKKSLHSFYNEYANILVVGKDGIQLYNKESNEPLFFHPNLAMIRVKRLQKGDHDPFIDVTGIKEGDSLLDCTLGYASDSIVASYIVGKTGKVIGVEASPVLAFLIQEGLKDWEAHNKVIERAMRRIDVINGDHLHVLKNMLDNSVDVVYFDPMFEESIEQSNALQTISLFASHANLSTETITEAKRVARKKVVLKDHFRSKRFEQFGFQQHIRKTAKFHYGTIDV